MSRQLVADVLLYATEDGGKRISALPGWGCPCSIAKSKDALSMTHGLCSTVLLRPENAGGLDSFFLAAKKRHLHFAMPGNSTCGKDASSEKQPLSRNRTVAIDKSP